MSSAPALIDLTTICQREACTGYSDPDCLVHQREGVGLDEKYGQPLGEGSYGVVYKINNVTIQGHGPGSFAMKIQKMHTPHLKQGILLEKDMFTLLQAQVDQNNLFGLVLPLCMYDCKYGLQFRIWEARTPCNVQLFELCEGAKQWNDSGHIKKIFDDFSDLLQNVQRLHIMGFVHADLKPDNLLICGRTRGAVEKARLADYGLSVFFKAFAPREVAGHALGLDRMKGGTPYFVFPAFCMMVTVHWEAEGTLYDENAWRRVLDDWVLEEVPPARAMPWYHEFIVFLKGLRGEFEKWKDGPGKAASPHQQKKDPRLLKISGKKISVLLDDLAPDFLDGKHCRLSPAALNDFFGLLVIIIFHLDPFAADESVCAWGDGYTYETCLCSSGGVHAYMDRMLNYIDSLVDAKVVVSDTKRQKFFDGVKYCAKIFNGMTQYLDEYATWLHHGHPNTRKWARQALHWKYWSKVTKHYQDKCFKICAKIDQLVAEDHEWPLPPRRGGAKKGRAGSRRGNATSPKKLKVDVGFFESPSFFSPEKPKVGVAREKGWGEGDGWKILDEGPVAHLADWYSSLVRGDEGVWADFGKADMGPADYFEGEEIGTGMSGGVPNEAEIMQAEEEGRGGGKRKKIKSRRKLKKSKKKIKTKSLIHNTKLRKTKKNRLKKKKSPKCKQKK